MKKKTKTEKFAGISLRLSPEACRQLDDLMLWWGENRSRVICRAIDKTHSSILLTREHNLQAGRKT